MCPAPVICEAASKPNGRERSHVPRAECVFVKVAVLVDHQWQGKLPPDKFNRTGAHRLGRSAVGQQVYRSRGEGIGIMRRNQIAVPSVFDDVAAAWHP